MMSHKMLRHAPPNPQVLRKVRVYPTRSPSPQVPPILPSRIPFLLLPLPKGTKEKDLMKILANRNFRNLLPKKPRQTSILLELLLL
jgi:hypothetical protein